MIMIIMIIKDLLSFFIGVRSTSFSETAKALQQFHRAGDLLHFIRSESGGRRHDVDNLDGIKAQFIYPYVAFKIDLTNLHPEKLLLEFKQTNQSFKAEILLIDRNQATSRPLLATNLRQKGNRISSKVGYLRQYLLQFEQQSFQEEDITANCLEYPTKNFKNYEECDKENIMQSLRYLNLNDLTPVWLTDIMDEVTEEREMRMDDDEFEAVFSDIFSGYSEVQCLDPCTRTFTYSKFLSDNKDASGGTFIQLVIANDVTVEKTELVAFNFLLSLSYLGGNMGLWLGLGAVQLMEILTKFSMKKLNLTQIFH